MINQQTQKDNHSITSNSPLHPSDTPQHTQQQTNQKLISQTQIQKTPNQLHLKLLKQLLSILNMQQTRQTLQQQTSKHLLASNPQQSNTKITASNIQQQSNNNHLQRLIQSSNNLEDLMQIIQLYPLDTPNSHHHQQITYKITSILQNLFAQKHTATIPIHKALDIQLENKQIIFTDINKLQQICLLDSQNQLHLIDCKAAHKKSKIPNKQLIPLALKWIDKQKIVIGTNLNQFLIYSNALFLLYSLQPEQTQLISMQMHKLSINLNVQTIVTITQNPSGYIAVTHLHTDSQPIIQNTHHFFYKQPIKHTTILKTAYYSSLTPKDNQLAGLKTYQTVEQYYAVSKHNTILKFDSQVHQVGLLCKIQQRSIITMNASRCLSYLHLIVAQETYPSIRQRQTKFSMHYEFIKLNCHGATLARVPLDLHNVLQGQPLTYIANLQPDWLCCTSHNNNLLYFSLRTGKTVYTQELQKPKRGKYNLSSMGPQNSLLLSTHKHLRLLSIFQQQKKEIMLECPFIEPRGEIIRRFSLIQGLPENLQLLLQSIRNNQL